MAKRILSYVLSTSSGPPIRFLMTAWVCFDSIWWHLSDVEHPWNQFSEISLRTSTRRAGEATGSPYWSRRSTGSERRVAGRAGWAGGRSSQRDGSTRGAGDSQRASRPPAVLSAPATKSDKNWRSVDMQLLTKYLFDHRPFRHQCLIDHIGFR